MDWVVEVECSPVEVDRNPLDTVGGTATEANPAMVEVESFAKDQVRCEGQDRLGNAGGNHRVDGWVGAGHWRADEHLHALVPSLLTVLELGHPHPETSALLSERSSDPSI